MAKTDEQKAQEAAAADADAAKAEIADAQAATDAIATENADVVLGPESAVSTSAQQQAALLNAAGHDPSDTYTHGVPGANVNTAVPEGAEVVSTFEEAQKAGYFGYSPGAKATPAYSFSAKGAVVNASAAEADKAAEAKK